MPLTREDLVAALRRALEPRPDVLALWEGGSAAWRRADELSDLDVQLVAEDGRAEAVLEAAEHALSELSPVELRWVVPGIPWHGHAQRFYRLRDAGPFLLVDLVVMQRSNEARFTEPEQHGHALVHFDKLGLLRPPPFDAARFRERMRAELDSAVTQFRLFGSFVEKEVRRGNPLDALNFHVAFTIRPLVTALGVRYRPLRYAFGLRYLRDDLPEAVHAELAALCYPRDATELPELRRRAETLLERTLAEIDLDAIPLEQLSATLRSSTQEAS